MVLYVIWVDQGTLDLCAVLHALMRPNQAETVLSAVAHSLVPHGLLHNAWELNVQKTTSEDSVKVVHVHIRHKWLIFHKIFFVSNLRSVVAILYKVSDL